MLGKLKKNWHYVLLIFILFLAFFLRIYNINNLLGFYYDQGRDALVVWDFIYNGKLFLIGPTTGLAGIFRGPFYYYLISPFYALGGGNPIYPSIFLSLTSVLAIYISYYLGEKFLNKEAGIISAIIASFSFQIVWASRWLSNPTPMMLLSMLLVFAMYKVVGSEKFKTRKYWYLISLLLGLSFFSFGSSGELFYFPAVAIFTIWQRKKLDFKTILISSLIFVLTFLPQIIFDIRHNGILRAGITKNFIEEKSFAFPTKHFIENRTKSYYDIFSTKLFHSRGKYEVMALVSLFFIFILNFKNIFKNSGSKILLLLLGSSLIGLYFYHGNQAILYDYYMTGYYLIFTLIVGLILGSVWRYKLGKIFVLFFVYLFILNNYYPLNYKLRDRSDGPNSIAFVNQKNAIDWIYKNASGDKFNVDVYVPPVIPYAYDYLFKWMRLGNVGENVPSLYTLYEKDDNGKVRLADWLARHQVASNIIEQKEFGGIVVQRRLRK